MCGIISIYEKENLKFNPDYLYKMADKLKYRGPDEISFYNNSPVLIAHTRLSIIDLNTGSQPIFNEDKSILCILNGEIYNYRELRKKLINKKHVFVSNSDTEVIVHLYEEYGNDFFVHLNGMFAIALYDIKNDIMLIGRDRMGEKPVIYYEDEKFFIFASEIKCLLSSGLIEKKINYEALSLYMNSLYVPAPLTIIDKCKKLQPASYIKIQNKVLSLHKYWNPNVIIDRKSSEEDFCQIFNEIFNDAVKIRLEADVPLGVFLSGGIDSSAVAAYAAMQSKNKVKTFCVGFSDNMDERPYAKLVSEKFKTNHFEIFVGSLTSDDIINSLEYYDEPFADSSSVPSYFISKEARKHVKVILTGDGGDEFFSGYNYYVKNKYNFSNKYFNYVIEKINNTSIKNLKIDLYKYIYNKINKKKFILSNFSRSYFNIYEIKALLKNKNIYSESFWNNNAWINLNGKDSLTYNYTFDCNYYLPDDLLKKMDMASMANSLETRAPFLDHRLFELAFKIPPEIKLKNDKTKYILKKSLSHILPQSILNREKHGFGSPIDSWIKNQLKDHVNELKNKNSNLESHIDIEFVEKIVNKYFSRIDDWRLPHQIWILIALNVWINKYL